MAEQLLSFDELKFGQQPTGKLLSFDELKAGGPQPAQVEAPQVAPQMTPEGLPQGFPPPAPTEDEMLGREVGQADLGDVPMSTLARFLVGNADTVGEKIRAFKTQYPDGEIVQTKDGTFLFRSDPSQSFSRVDPKKFEPLGDIVDFLAPDFGALAGEVAVALFTGGTSLVGTVIRQALGALGGEAIEQGLQTAGGITEPGTELEQLTSKPIQAGVESVITGTLTAPLDPIVRAARGGGVLPVDERARAAQEAFKRLGQDDGLLISQASDIGLVRRIEGQSAAIFPNLERALSKQQVGLLDTLQGIRDPATKAKVLPALMGFEKRAQERLLADANFRQKSILEGGEALQKGVLEYDAGARARVRAAYAAAESIESPRFSLRDEIEIDGEVTTVLAEVRKAKAGVRGFSRPDPETGIRKTVPLDEASPELMDVLRKLSKLDPTLPPGPRGESPVEQLRKIRTQLWEIKTPVTGDNLAKVVYTRSDQRVAAKLFTAVDELLKNPANTTPEFRAAWRTAGELAHQRFQTLEQAIIRDASLTQNPDKLAAQLFGSGGQPEVSNLLMLRRHMPAERFAEFQDAAKGHLLRDPATMVSRLDAMEPETRAIIFSPSDQRVLRQLGAQWEQVERIGADTIARTMQDADAAVNALIERNASPGDVRRFVAGFSQAPLDERRAVQAALIEHLYQGATKREGGRIILNAPAFDRNWERLQRMGWSSMLPGNQKAVLEDLTFVLNFVGDRTPDVGTSIIAGSRAAAVTKELGAVVHPSESASIAPFIDLFLVNTVGRIMASPKARKLLIGTKNIPKSRLFAKLGSIASALMSETVGVEDVPPELSGTQAPGGPSP